MRIKLGEIGKIITGNTPKTSEAENYNSNDICFIKPSDILENDIAYIYKSEFYLSEIARNKARVLPKNSLLVTCIGIIGKVAINKVECAFNQQINAIIPNLNKCLPNYLAYTIQYKKDEMQKIANAAVVPILNKTQFSNIEVFIPMIEEQQKIAVVLDKVSELITLRKKQLEKLDELVKSRFVEMFGDPVSNSFCLPEATLPELGEFGRGVSKHRPRNAPELLGGSYPLIQTGEVAAADLYIISYENTYSELGFQQSKMWDKGTLCITIAANIARTAILGFDACFPDSVVGFNANEKVNNIFIHYWFSFFQTILEAQAPESAQKNINLKILSELKVIVPPVNKQNQFSNFVQQVDKQKSSIQQSLDKLEVLKKALMQEYFG